MTVFTIIAIAICMIGILILNYPDPRLLENGLGFELGTALFFFCSSFLNVLEYWILNTECTWGWTGVWTGDCTGDTGHGRAASAVQRPLWAQKMFLFWFFIVFLLLLLREKLLLLLWQGCWAVDDASNELGEGCCRLPSLRLRQGFDSLKSPQKSPEKSAQTKTGGMMLLAPLASSE